jgi:hypothetical protein
MGVLQEAVRHRSGQTERPGLGEPKGVSPRRPAGESMLGGLNSPADFRSLSFPLCSPSQSSS